MVSIGEVAFGCIRIVTCLVLIAEILHIDVPKRKEVVAAFIVGILSGALSISLGLTMVWQMGIEAVIAALFAEHFQQGQRKMCLFVSIYSEIAFGLLHVLMGVILGIVFHDQRYLEDFSQQSMIAVWISGSIFIVCILLMRNKKIKELNRGRALFFVSFLLMFAFVSLAEQQAIKIPQETLVMWIIFAVNLFAGVIMFNVSKQYNMEKQLAEMSAQQAALIEKDYTDLSNAYAANAKLFHDFHNHIGMIRQLVTSENYADAIAYLDELQAPIHEMTNSRWTGEQAVDYLINEKLAMAGEHGILLQIQVEYPNHSNIKSVDMCAILGNLLDNALEATKQVSKEELRYINLVIRRINQMLVIKVENGFEKELRQENGELKTTKMDGGLHGWGIKSVKTAVDKYEGSVKHSQEGQQFKVVATLNFEGIELE